VVTGNHRLCECFKMLLLPTCDKSRVPNEIFIYEQMLDVFVTEKTILFVNLH
jgi:hypothetical protein